MRSRAVTHVAEVEGAQTDLAHADAEGAQLAAQGCCEAV